MGTLCAVAFAVMCGLTLAHVAEPAPFGIASIGCLLAAWFLVLRDGGSLAVDRATYDVLRARLSPGQWRAVQAGYIAVPDVLALAGLCGTP